MTAQSIEAGDGGGYARYLQGKTRVPAAGRYYLTPEGEPAQAPGRWLASPETLRDLGIAGVQIDGPDFVALIEGRHPQTGRAVRPEGAGGGRSGGVDVTFSAPKSVSIRWALSDEQQRIEIERAHSQAVEQALAYLREHAPLVRRRHEGLVVEEPAADLLAAEYRHTTARGVDAHELPDPHLHSHVVITSVVRADGQIAAVSSRPVFRAARETGAFYRSALAANLAELGCEIEPQTGKDGRYFELAGVSRELRDAFSRRAREVQRHAERFRAKYGRAPKRGELRTLKAEHRPAKRLVDRGELDRAWRQTADRQPSPGQLDHNDHQRELSRPADQPIEQVIEQRLTERSSTFTIGELRATVLEQTAGRLDPHAALELAAQMTRDRTVIPLEGGRMTTLALRAAEQRIQRQLTAMSLPADRDTGERAREQAAQLVAERIGATLTDEQSRALHAITGAQRAAILIGPAGTGKGVVIDAAARAEQLAGADTWGIAVAGSTAQRLGHDTPALTGKTLTLDRLLAATANGRIAIGPHSTIYFDEAGMADTRRLSGIASLVERTGAKLVLIGDAAQLPSIGAGGMFEHLTQRLPTVQLGEVMRARDPQEKRAWADMRAGRTDRAMAHYRSQERLNIADTRDQAIERAANAWEQLTRDHDPSQVLLISDASNHEIDRINARAQQLRLQRGELGERQLELPATHYTLRRGDRVILTAQHHQHGLERIENGSRGEIAEITADGGALIRFDLTGREALIAGNELANVRLAYAQHIHRAQGATVEHALIITGGWQTSQESAYVQATRARATTSWYVNREDLGTDGQDSDRIERLSKLMQHSRAQQPSLTPPRTHDAGPPSWLSAAREHPLYAAIGAVLTPGRSRTLDRPTPPLGHPDDRVRPR